MSERFDWNLLLGAGLRGLRLLPRDFWALTPAELALMLGAGAMPAMDRKRLEELTRLWPDRRGAQPGAPADAQRSGQGIADVAD